MRKSVNNPPELLQKYRPENPDAGKTPVYSTHKCRVSTYSFNSLWFKYVDRPNYDLSLNLPQIILCLNVTKTLTVL